MVEIPRKDMDDPRHKTTTMNVPMILPRELLDFLIATWSIKKMYVLYVWIHVFFF